MIREWSMETVKDFNNNVSSEEDMKNKVLIPYLISLGYKMEDMRFENSIHVQIGTKKTIVYSDIEIIINGKVEMVIDAKKPINSISEKDVLQVVSYAKLIDTPQALYGITTNGIECVTVDTYTGKRVEDIPSKSQLLRAVDKAKKTMLKEIEIREVRSILFTLSNPQELYKVIQKCKDVIEKRGLIRSDQSFREMTKVLLIKMNEERRVKAKEGQNRFTYEYISASAKVNDVEEKVIFKQLFDEAKAKYPEIYTNEDEKLNITDNACIITLIKSLAPFSFIGTGDDIKGAVYEIFLKSTLRGEFDQFFTPREIVDFIVRFADPNVGDVILDPSCGSGGFLIQAFTYVNAKINSAGYSEIENNNKFQALIDKCLWGQEADYDLHVLAKINLIMHGDGYNNIYQGDTLKSRNIPDNYFDYVLANPPFTTPYEFKDVLSNYELGIGKESEELDILFVEKSIRALKPNGDLYIVLPEGLLNNRRYLYFRKWILKKTDLLMSVSLPEGAFIPFGGSVSKTCIIGLRKKGDDGNYIRPEYVFLGAVNEIGYECGKKGYRQHNQNDLLEFNNLMNEIFSGLKCTTNGGTCGWIKQDEISDYRMDANFLLNKIDRVRLEKKFDKMIPLSEVCTIDNKSVNIYKDNIYNYLEVLDISPVTGTITNIRKRYGYEIGDSFNKFEKGDILFTRINPRISRVAIAPQIDDFGVVSKEVYRLVYKENKYIKKENFYVICAILRNEDIVQQIVRLSTGSSSSRARVQKEDLLNEVFIPVIDEKVQKSISNSTYNTSVMIWKQAQAYLKTYEKNQKLLGSNVSMNELRSI